MVRDEFKVAALTIALAGCSSFGDEYSVGNGQYLQVLRGQTVILETDTSNAGMMNCPNQVYRLIRDHPSMSSTTKCSSRATTDSLPFSFRAHRQLTESDGYKRASPFITRTATSQMCATIREATAKMEQTVILEDSCGAGSVAVVVRPTQPTTPPPGAAASVAPTQVATPTVGAAKLPKAGDKSPRGFVSWTS